MEWDEIRLHWVHLQDLVQRRWPELTPDDIDVMAGSRTYMIDVVQERTGCSREQATRQVAELVPAMLSAIARRKSVSYDAPLAWMSPGFTCWLSARTPIR